MKRFAIIITVHVDLLEGDDLHRDARILESKCYEMLADRDWLNQKKRNPTVGYLLKDITPVDNKIPS